MKYLLAIKKKKTNAVDILSMVDFLPVDFELG